MPNYVNGTGVPLSVAVFLATDNYDYEPGTFSTTALIKPLRQSILGARVKSEDDVIDVIQLVKSRLGTAIHDSIEKAWLGNYRQAMAALGHPESVINRVKVNPNPATLNEDDIPVYMEQRHRKEIDGITITGKYDFVADGVLEDFKSTGTFTWTKGTKTKDYQLQGSIYRWLAPEIITADHMHIQFIFTDWMAGKAKADTNYPQAPVTKQLIPLMPIEETEAYVRNRINEYKRLCALPDEQLPKCTPEDLWQTEPVYKYYKDPNKRARSTKNCSSYQEALAYQTKMGGKGIIVEVPGEAKACHYCRAFSICKQKDDLINEGILNVGV